METIEIELLGANPNPAARAALTEADVIIGVDVATQREFTVYGTPSLENTISLDELSAMRTVRVLLDANSHGLEELTSLVQVIKGLKGRRPR